MAENFGAKVVERKKKNKPTSYDLTGDVISMCDIDLHNMLSMCRSAMGSGKMTVRQAVESQILAGIKNR